MLQAASQQPGVFFGKKPNFDAYESNTGEGLGIVAQMGVLRQTFMDDKQAAIDEENRQQQANLQQEAKDEEAYLGGVKQQCVDGEAMYVRRKEDRGKERAGIAEAVRVLQKSAAAISAVAPPAFVQLKLS